MTDQALRFGNPMTDDGRLIAKHKSLDSMIGGVDDMELADAVLANRPGVLKLSRFAPGRTPNAKRLSVEIELLNPMITVLTHKDMTFAVENKVVRIAQATRRRSGLSKRLDEYGTVS